MLGDISIWPLKIPSWHRVFKSYLEHWITTYFSYRGQLGQKLLKPNWCWEPGTLDDKRTPQLRWRSQLFGTLSAKPIFLFPWSPFPFSMFLQQFWPQILETNIHHMQMAALQFFFKFLRKFLSPHYQVLQNMLSWVKFHSFWFNGCKVMAHSNLWHLYGKSQQSLTSLAFMFSPEFQMPITSHPIRISP